MRAIHAFPVLCLAFAAPASAQPITIEDARDMAFDKGIVQIEEVELDDGLWEVEGVDASGHRIKMKIEARSGRIVKIKRD
jgi:uncharacterized membrane protein YkoI